VEQYDIVIVGGGVQGLSAAYQISRASSRSVLLLESRGRLGDGSSGRSASMLMKSRENEIKIAMSIYSYEWLMDFEAKFGEALSFRRTGFLSVVPHGTLEQRYLHEHELRVAMSVPSQLLSPDELRSLAPGVNVGDISFGVLGSDDGEIRARQIVDAYARAADAQGVEISTNERVLEIALLGNRVSGVRTDRRAVSCGLIINAAGAWALDLAAQVGVVLPMQNRVRHLVTAVTNNSAYLTGPMVEDAEMEWYYRPLDDSRVLIGVGKDADGDEDFELTDRQVDAVRAGAARRAPGLVDVRVVGGSSGYRSITPDILPILGPVDGVEGYICNTGWGGEGIMHSPIGGLIASYWAVGGPEPPIDPSTFLLSRFNDKIETKEKSR
jgi:sarcosine oxidase, subunit beta